MKGCEVAGKMRRGWCRRHYRKWKVHGDPGYEHPLRQCSMEDCKRVHSAKGYCSMHYTRWRRHGDAGVAAQTRFSDPEEALAAQTEWAGDCLVWTGGRDSNGYGRIWDGQQRMRVHRYVYGRESGGIPGDLMVDHRCHNRACVNPEHLRLATNAQNTANKAGLRSDNTSGFRGVSWDSWHGSWVARVGHKNLGRFKSVEDAVAMVRRARKELYGEYAGRG